MRKYALLSFDAEEFDVPREQGVEMPLVESVRISEMGMTRVLDLLAAANVKATFFCTVNFAHNAPHIIKRIILEGHELAAHGVDHWQPSSTDAAQSYKYFQNLCRELGHQENMPGYRQPRMHTPDPAELQRVGFRYDSSLHPTLIPGHYNNLSRPRLPYMSNGVLQIPISVTPLLRIPLFWLSLHHFPFPLYKRFALKCLKHDGIFNTYLHPWEFVDLSNPKWKIGYLHRHRSGEYMAQRLSSLIEYLKAQDAEFITYSQLAQTYIS